jgi:hypothetical protein
MSKSCKSTQCINFTLFSVLATSIPFFTTKSKFHIISEVSSYLKSIPDILEQIIHLWFINDAVTVSDHATSNCTTSER